MFDNTEFAINLAKQFPSIHSIDAKVENCVVSPLAITISLLMCLLGSKSETRVQLTNTLFDHPSYAEDEVKHFTEYLLGESRKSGKNFELASDNRFYLANRYRVNPEFQQKVANLFHNTTMLESVDFVADSNSLAEQINKWITEFSHNRIKDIIQASKFHKYTAFVLVSSFYLKATWANPFPPPKPMRFYPKLGESVDVHGMSHNEQHHSYYENFLLQALELRFSCGVGSMLILLPKDGFGIHELLPQLNKTYLTYILSELKGHRVEVKLPKFKIESAVELRNDLKNLGITNAFDEMADFTSMTTSLINPSISDIFHTAFVEVNENGVDVAGATTANSVNGAISAAPVPSFKFIADHPFLFIILGSRTTLHPVPIIRLIGQVVQPIAIGGRITTV